jgi:hypothetical protein
MYSEKKRWAVGNDQVFKDNLPLLWGCCDSGVTSRMRELASEQGSTT